MLRAAALASMSVLLVGCVGSQATRASTSPDPPVRVVIRDAAAPANNHQRARTVPPPAAPPIACAAAVACVELASRTAWLRRDDGRLLGPVHVGIGTPDHRTPAGRFHVVWKARHRVSNVYGLPMEYAVYFAAGGIAFHAGPVATPSHGCVHLPTEAAASFFAVLKPGDLVIVT
ncbi:MAG: hypothetical protein QOK42_200 [Frankiaceae bacterium]|nr:hypothetical protein [Frankiaceae bacterium]